MTVEAVGPLTVAEIFPNISERERLAMCRVSGAVTGVTDVTDVTDPPVYKRERLAMCRVSGAVTDVTEPPVYN